LFSFQRSIVVLQQLLYPIIGHFYCQQISCDFFKAFLKLFYKRTFAQQ